MNIEKRVVGIYQENCYLIKKENYGLVVDPGDEVEKLLDMIGNTKVEGILITHAHFDHIGALKELEEKLNVPIYYHNINNELQYEKLINIEEQDYNTNHFKFKVVYTPGHRNDSVTYYFEEEQIMFTGDFLFYLSIGRTDLEYANKNDMVNSIKLIKSYQDDIVFYPGHGTSSNLGFEKKYNNYLINI